MHLIVALTIALKKVDMIVKVEALLMTMFAQELAS